MDPTAADSVEQNYRSILNHVKDVVFQLDSSSHVTYLNPAWTELTGLEIGATLGTHFRDLIVDEDRVFSAQQARHLFDGRTPFSRHDFRLRSSTGEGIWVEVWAQATRDAAGAIVGVTGTLRDVTERKAIEAAQWEAQETLEREIAESSVGFFTSDCTGRITRSNAAGAKMLGRDIADVVGKNWQTFVRADELERFLKAARELLAGRYESATRMVAHERGDGATVYTRMHAFLLRDADGAPVEFFNQLEDVTAEQNAEQRLRAAEDRFRVIFQESPTAMCTAQTDGRLTQINSALQRSLGDKAEVATGPNARFAELVHPDDRVREQALFSELVGRKRASYACELRILQPRGSWRWFEVSAKLLDGGVDVPSYALRTLVDISKRKRSEATLRREAESDALTGLLNRRAFERIVTDRIAEAREHGNGGALFMFDLDGFKAVNDTFGHQAGDDVLTALAKGLVARLRASDVVARLGGDEFAVLTPNGEDREVRAVAAAIVQTIEATTRRVLRADRPAISASVGATRIDGSEGYEPLMEVADAAMYRAKRNGGGQAAFAPVPEQEAAGMIPRE